MTAAAQPTPHPPATTTVKRKRPRRRPCANCDATFEVPNDHKRNCSCSRCLKKFCCDQCRFDYNRHGGAFRKLKAILPATVAAAIRAEREKEKAEIQATIDERLRSFKRELRGDLESFALKVLKRIQPPPQETVTIQEAKESAPTEPAD